MEHFKRTKKKYEEAKIKLFWSVYFVPFRKYFTFVSGLNICFIIVLLTVFCELTIAIHEYDIFDTYFDSLNL